MQQLDALDTNIEHSLPVLWLQPIVIEHPVGGS